MKNICLKISIFLFATFNLAAQIHVTGFVTDSATGERLIGVNIIAESGGTTSDNNGFFSLRARPPAVVRASHIGYNPVVIEIERDTLINIRMVAGGMELSEMVVTAHRWQPPSVVSLSTRELLNIPALGGKPDVLKAAHLLPGVNPQSEGSSLCRCAAAIRAKIFICWTIFR
jgi:hypothetical protein